MAHIRVYGIRDVKEDYLGEDWFSVQKGSLIIANEVVCDNATVYFDGVDYSKLVGEGIIQKAKDTKDFDEAINLLEEELLADSTTKDEFGAKEVMRGRT